MRQLAALLVRPAKRKKVNVHQRNRHRKRLIKKKKKMNERKKQTDRQKERKNE